MSSSGRENAARWPGRYVYAERREARCRERHDARRTRAGRTEEAPRGCATSSTPAARRPRKRRSSASPTLRSSTFRTPNPRALAASERPVTAAGAGRRWVQLQLRGRLRRAGLEHRSGGSTQVTRPDSLGCNHRESARCRTGVDVTKSPGADNRLPPSIRRKFPSRPADAEIEFRFMASITESDAIKTSHEPPRAGSRAARRLPLDPPVAGSTSSPSGRPARPTTKFTRWGNRLCAIIEASQGRARISAPASLTGRMETQMDRGERRLAPASGRACGLLLERDRRCARDQVRHRAQRDRPRCPSAARGSSERVDIRRATTYGERKSFGSSHGGCRRHTRARAAVQSVSSRGEGRVAVEPVPSA